MNTENVEEIRRQLAETSIELEEQRERYKRQQAKAAKDIEQNYRDLDVHKADDKKMRVKINQIEQELLLQIKRLDILCKSKGLPRPKRDHLVGLSPSVGTNTRGTYVSPYSRTKVSPAAGTTNQRSGSYTNNNSRGRVNSNTRQPSIDSTGKPDIRNSKYYNSNYTPPNRNKVNMRSPSLGANSNNSASGRPGSKGKSPVATMMGSGNNRIRRGPVGYGGGGGGMMRSPSNVSENSTKKSVKSSGYGKPTENKGPQYNRVYTPNGGKRSNSGAYNSGGSQPRARREPAVLGAINAHNPVSKKPEFVKGVSLSRLSSGKRNFGNISNRSKSDKSDKSDRSDNSAKRREPHTNLISAAKTNKFVMNTR
jgi:hypothetical protein